MRIITEAKKLEGKTIKFVDVVDYNEQKIGLIFTDDTCALIEPYKDYDDTEVQLANKIDSYIQVKMGIITEEEHEKILDKQRIKMVAIQRKMELAELKRLKQKYFKGE